MKKKTILQTLVICLLLSTSSVYAANRALWMQYVNFKLVRVDCIEVEGGCLNPVEVEADREESTIQVEDDSHRRYDKS